MHVHVHVHVCTQSTYMHVYHVCLVCLQKAAAAHSRLVRTVSGVDGSGRGQGSHVVQETVDFLNYCLEVWEITGIAVTRTCYFLSSFSFLI